MCSVNDTDNTYCSEVEELLKSTSFAPKKSCENVPLRRSQRLSQKYNPTILSTIDVGTIATGEEVANTKNLFDTMRSRNEKSTKFAEDIFSTKEISPHFISINEILNCRGKDVKDVPVAGNLPLDLSMKSKVLTLAAPQPQVARANAKNNQASETKRGRRKKSSNNNINAPVYGSRKTSFCKNNLKNGPNKTEKLKNISTDPINVYKRTYECLQLPKDNSALIAAKTMKLSNKNISNSTQDENFTNRIQHARNPTTKIVKGTPSETPDRVPYKRTYKRKSSDKNSKLISGITKKIATKHVKENQLKNHDLNATNFMTPSNKEAAIAKKKSRINDLQPAKRSHKVTSRSSKNLSKRKGRSNEMQHDHRNLKTEQSTYGETECFQPCAENISTINTVTKEVQSNLSEVNSEMPTSGRFRYPKSTELNSSRILRRVTKRSDGSSANSENRSNNLESGCTKIKTEIFSQKSCKEKELALASQPASPAKTKEPSDQHDYKELLNKNKLENIIAKTHLNTSSGKKDGCKQPVGKTVQEKTVVGGKNYIKLFDRNQFLDKIQNARSYIDKLSAENNNCSNSNSLGIPPTPADSSQEFVKNSILPIVYPPHFKDQLSPKSAFTRSVNLQTHPTHVITPDDSISAELLESSSSSPSLPESLCEIFHTKDIKDILNVERTSYRLHTYHIQALALILNLRLEYLRHVLDKLINISPNVLKNIDKAVKMPFVPDHDIFASSPVELWTSNDMVLNSQSPKRRKMSSTITDNRTRY